MVGGRPFNISPLGQTPAMWAYAIVLGFISIPFGMIIRLIPDALVERLVPESLKRRAHTKIPGVTVSDDDERFSSYPAALADVRDELAFLKRIKGGRINNLKFAMKHPREVFIPKAKTTPTHSREHSRSNSVKLPTTPTRENSFGSVGTPDSRKRSRSMRSRSNSALGAATVMTGIVAGSIAAGWSPIDRNGDRDFGQFPPKSQPSPTATKDDGNVSGPPPTLIVGDSMSDEPQEISQDEGTSSVPRLRVPQPPSSSGRKSFS